MKITDDELNRLLNDFENDIEPEEPSLCWVAGIAGLVSIAIVVGAVYWAWGLAHG